MTYCTTLYQYNITSFCTKPFRTTTIYILFRAEIDCAISVKLDIAHFVHVIWMSDRWPPCILPDGLPNPAQLYKRRIELIFTLGKNFLVRNDSFKNDGLKVPWNANACWFVLIYNTLTITNVAKRLFKYMPYILL